MQRIVDFSVNWIDKLTKIPGALSETADRLNDEFINAAEQIKSGGEAAARKNLTTQKVQSIGKSAATWVYKNTTLLMVAVASIAAIIYYTKK